MLRSKSEIKKANIDSIFTKEENQLELRTRSYKYVYDMIDQETNENPDFKEDFFNSLMNKIEVRVSKSINCLRSFYEKLNKAIKKKPSDDKISLEI